MVLVRLETWALTKQKNFLQFFFLFFYVLSQDWTFFVFRQPSHNSFVGKLPFYIYMWRIFFHSSCKIFKKNFFPSAHFYYDFKLKIYFVMAPTYTWDPYRYFGVSERLCNTTYQHTNNSQSLAYWFVKKLLTMWNRIIYFVNNCNYSCMSVFCQGQGSDYH